MNECINLVSTDAWKILSEDRESVLVDVRTDYEWSSVGYPDLCSIKKKLIMISWRFYPDMLVNNNFNQEFDLLLNIDKKIFFICKSGGRSYEAACTEINRGYRNCYNIIDGFEGNKNGELGWLKSGLPVINRS